MSESLQIKPLRNSDDESELEQKRALLRICHQLLGTSALTPEIFEIWDQLLSTRTLEELRYAFGEWNQTQFFFPKPAQIRERCEAYRSKTDDNSPIGRDYEKWKDTQRLAAAEGKLASDQDYAEMNRAFKEIVNSRAPAARIPAAKLEKKMPAPVPPLITGKAFADRKRVLMEQARMLLERSRKARQ